MTLFQKLQQAKTEEDVKDAYISALGLKGYSKNLIDIQTKEIWFEAKEGSKNSTYQMFTQLLHYVQQALTAGEDVPPFLCVIDTKKAAIMRTEDALPLLNNKKQPIKWGKNASGYTQEALDIVSSYIGTYFVSFKIETHEQEFISAIKSAIKSGEIIRTQITPANLKQVFDKWVKMIGVEVNGISSEDYALLFYADIMSDGNVSTHNNLPAELLHRNNSPVFSLNGKLYELGSKEGYRQFWAIYNRPPKQEYRNYLLERRDSLIPIDERSFKGAYYTPLHIVDKAYDKLAEVLGDNWQREYIVWDMCCGVGNLEVKHSFPRNIYMSTLDIADIDVMKATKTCVSATRFQYDYLNDDVTDDGKIDYSLTKKMPLQLQEAIKSNKKILVFINPPYAEATNADNTAKGENAKNKAGVAKTKFAAKAMDQYGKASNELFTQFIARIAQEIPNATIAIFSKMKYINAPNFEKFRNAWKADYLGGFIVHSKAFDGLKGEFPIGFLVWATKNDEKSTSLPIEEVVVEVLNKEGVLIGEKTFYNLPVKSYLNLWVKRPRANNVDVVPLSNALSIMKGTPRVKTWANGAVAYMCSGTNDLQNAGKYTFILSSAAGRGNGFYITEENLPKAAVVFTVQKIIKPTWQNDRDQFLQPSLPINSEFELDCLIWTLFNGSNLTASANGIEWNGKKWSIVNHFIPFTELEVGSPERFESDFMVRYLSGKVLSSESLRVLSEAKKLWQAYFSYIDELAVRQELMLNRVDVGWYQVRKALQARVQSGGTANFNFLSFEQAYKGLTEKLLPLVYEYGFLKV
jgi:hypothetical protein